jgi:hypothetical protein
MHLLDLYSLLLLDGKTWNKHCSSLVAPVMALVSNAGNLFPACKGLMNKLGLEKQLVGCCVIFITAEVVRRGSLGEQSRLFVCGTSQQL